jgi:hypothetical protein
VKLSPGQQNGITPDSTKFIAVGIHGEFGF